MRFLIILPAALLLVACGADSSPIMEPQPEPERDILQGHLAGLAIEGLSYTTETQLGVTDAAGGFEYVDGEFVTFRLGDTTLATVAAAKSVPYHSLVPDAELPSLETDIADAVHSGESTPFLRLFNITRLLISMDEDQNPANGISIDEITRQVFEGVELDFRQSEKRFANACADVLEKTDKLMFVPAYAAKYLYLAANIPIAIKDKRGSGVLVHYTRIETDKTGNGQIDYFETRKYNVEGDITSRYWENADGSSHDIYDHIEQTYDVAGRMTRQTHGESEHTYTYDRVGNQASLLIKRNSVVQYAYSFDSHGNKIGYTVDYNADDSIEMYAVSSFNEDDFLLSERLFDANSKLDYSYSLEYDTGNRPTRISEDYDGDEKSDFIIEYEYTTSGKVKSEIWDYDGDGPIEPSITNNVYDDNGNNVGSSLEDEAGNIFFATINRYDANALLVEILIDEGVDGAVVDGDIDSAYYYDYDEAGNRTRYARDDNYDGTPEQIESWEYDAAGNETFYGDDSDGDGVNDFTIRRNYNADGHIAQVIKDLDGDGVGDNGTYYMVEESWLPDL